MVPALEFDPYKELGIDYDATASVIAKAFRRLALKYHPDKRRGKEDKVADEKFHVINKANDILSNEEKKKEVDKVIAADIERAKKQAEMDKGRREMVQKLQQREREAQEQKSGKNAQQSAQQEQILDRLREETKTRLYEVARGRIAKARVAAKQGKQDFQRRTMERGIDARAVKLTWPADLSDVDEQQIRSQLVSCGGIEDIRIVPGGKAMAVVVFNSTTARDRCLELFPSSGGNGWIAKKVKIPKAGSRSNSRAR